MKSNKHTKKFPYLLILSSCVLVTCVGYGSFLNVQMNEKKAPIEITAKQPVCYIGDIKYLTLDAALDAAYNNNKNDIIYVIPNLGFDVTILKDHILEKGDSLLLPYDGETVLNDEYKSSDNLKGFADNNTSNRKTHVVLSADKTLTIKGTMTIGAFTGTGSSPMGQASSSYSELEMGLNSTLNVEGNLNCYGFIKESRSGSSINVKNGGILTTPVVFYDYTSASNALGLYNNDVFPFEQFDIPSIRPKLLFYYGSSMIGRAHLWGSNVGNIITFANLIGKENSFINMLSSDSKIEWQYSDDEILKTSSSLSKHKTSIKFSGTGEFGSLSVTIKYFYTITINSKDYYLPVPYGYSITINNGANFKIPSSIKGIKFMPGSSLQCNEDSSITLDSSVLFYQNTTASDGTSFTYAPSTAAATFINNGSLFVNSGFEGNISTSTTKTASATSTFGWLSTSISDCKEGTSKSTYSWGGAFGLIKDTETKSSNFETGWIYTSTTGSDCWEKTNKLPVDISKVSIKAPDRTSSGVNQQGEFELEAIIEPSENDCSNIQYEWSIVGNPSTARFKDNIINQKTATLITDAAGSGSSSKDITYDVQVKITFTKSDKVSTATLTSATVQFKALADDGCVLPTALVLMADGTYKQAGLIKQGDIVMSFNHETGKIEPNKVIGNDHSNIPAKLYNVIHLEFTNGKTTDFIYEHGYFNKTLNKYIYIHDSDGFNFIGHEFVFYNNGQITTSKLCKVTQSKIYTTLAAPATANHLNLIVDNLLSVEGGLLGLFNIFDYNPNTLAFDKEKMQQDIDKYGLLDYEYFKKYFPKEIYDLLPCKYLGVSIGKKLITWDLFESYVSKWKDQLLENI